MRKLKPVPPLLILALAIAIPHQTSTGIGADELAAQVEEKYRSLKSLSVDFIKTVRSDIFETESTVKGKMVFKNPDRFKIESEDQTIVSDGEFVWTFSAENQQVIKNLIDRSQNLFKPYQYLSNFRSDYVPQLEGEEKIDRRTCFKLLLSARKENDLIRKMTAWVDKKDLLARKLQYEDSNDNQITLTFQHIRTNRKVKDSEFVYEAPPGVEEVDLTE